MFVWLKLNKKTAHFTATKKLDTIESHFMEIKVKYDNAFKLEFALLLV